MFAGRDPSKCIGYLDEFNLTELLFEEVPNKDIGKD